MSVPSGAVRGLTGMDGGSAQVLQRHHVVDCKCKRESKAGADRIPSTKPSHALADYAGDYENPAYGILKIALKSDTLQFGFHEFQFSMSHIHYDRFDTPDDEQYGKFSINFRTYPQGDIDSAVISLDQAEVVLSPLAVPGREAADERARRSPPRRRVEQYIRCHRRA